MLVFFLFSNKLYAKNNKKYKINKLKGNGNKTNRYILVFFFMFKKHAKLGAMMVLVNMEKVDKMLIVKTFKEAYLFFKTNLNDAV